MGGAAGQGRGGPAGHAFISYVHEDSRQVGRLQRKLEAAGVRVWRDTVYLRPGEDWRAAIRRAITDDAFVFIACFSQEALSRSKSYQNEELIEAIGQMRLRRDRWLIPVRLDDCQIPDLDIGAGKTLRSLQHVDLFGSRQGTARLVEAVQQLLWQQAAQDTTRPPAGHRVSRHGPGRSRTKMTLTAAAVLIAAAILIPVLILPDSPPRNPNAGPHTPGAGPRTTSGVSPTPSAGPTTPSASAGAGAVRILSGGSYGFDSPDAIAVDGTHLWIANFSSGSVTELNASDGTVVRALSAASHDLNTPVAIAA
jgi:hypothetical protein